MIVYVEESLFNSPAQVLVNTVNTVGVMGKGIAKEFKRRYPEMAAQYKELCERGLFEIGKLWLYRASSPWVLNFPTKRHWRERSRIEYIHSGLRKFVDTYRSRGVTSISFPMLGCGNGQLDWDEVRPVMEYYLKNLSIPVYIHIFQEAALVPEHLEPEKTAHEMRLNARELPFSEFWNDLERQLERKRVYVTQDGSQFEAYLSYDAEDVPTGAVIESAGEQHFIPKTEDGFWDLWHYICGAEYAYPDYFPAGLSRIADQVSTLLSYLDYIKIVPFKVSDSSVRNYGIRVNSTQNDTPVVYEFSREA
jgi:O-acetyl-ADP-ribose deacetylase (regulator of RNase III)